MHNDDFASSDHYRVGNSKLHTANAISLQNSQSVEQQPIKYIGQEFGESLNTLTLLNQDSILHQLKVILWIKFQVVS